MRAEQPTKLCKPQQKMGVNVGAPKNRFKPPGNCYWPSQGRTFVAVSSVYCLWGCVCPSFPLMFWVLIRSVPEVSLLIKFP